MYKASIKKNPLSYIWHSSGNDLASRTVNESEPPCRIHR